MSDTTDKTLDTAVRELPFLIAETNESLQQALVHTLNNAGVGGCGVVANGADAWQAWKNSRELGVIVTELKLPEMDGLELIKRVRADGMAKIQPAIIVMTDGDNPVELDAATKAGADCVVAKPFPKEQLIAMVQEGVEHRKQVAGADVFAQHALERKILQSKIRAELIFERYKTTVECDELALDKCILVVDNNYGLGTVLNMAFSKPTPGTEPYFQPIKGTITKIERVPHEFGTFRVHVKFNGKPKEAQGIRELLETSSIGQE